MVNRDGPQKEGPPTVEEVAIKLREHIDAAIATLGKAAAEGDVQAAKEVLAFVKAADQQDTNSKGRDMLQLVADIQRGNRVRAGERPNSP